MTDGRNFGSDLMAQNGTRDPESRKRRVSEMMTLVGAEKAAVRRLRVAAFVAWGLALLLPAGVLGMFYAQTLGPIQDEAFWTRVYLVSPILAMFGAVCLVGAAITTLAWFFRARTASLAAIETRLASLERLLSADIERPGS